MKIQLDALCKVVLLSQISFINLRKLQFLDHCNFLISCFNHTCSHVAMIWAIGPGRKGLNGPIAQSKGFASASTQNRSLRAERAERNGVTEVTRNWEAKRRWRQIATLQKRRWSNAEVNWTLSISQFSLLSNSQFSPSSHPLCLCYPLQFCPGSQLWIKPKK